MMEVLIEKMRTYSFASRHFTVGEAGPCAVLLASSQTPWPLLQIPSCCIWNWDSEKSDR